MVDRGIDADEAIDVVGRRRELLEALRTGPKYKPQLQAHFDVSRSTVYKAIRELEEIELVERTECGYELTLTGRLLLTEYDQFHATVESICEPGRLLALLPNDVDLPASLLIGAETTFAEPHMPTRPVSAFETMVREATVLKGSSSIVLPHLVKIVHRNAVADDLELELVLERPVIERLAANFGDELRESIASGNVTVRQTEDSLHYGLIVVEEPTEQVGIVIYGSNGELKGLVTNDTEDALAWARGVWKRQERETVRPDLDQFFEDSVSER